MVDSPIELKDGIFLTEDEASIFESPGTKQEGSERTINEQQGSIPPRLLVDRLFDTRLLEDTL